MNIKKILIAFAILLAIPASTAFAQTATATLTATPSPVPAKINADQSVTHFGYLDVNGNVQGAGNRYGGRVIRQKATAALFIGQAVIPDASNPGQVVVATNQTASHVIGVVVGKRTNEQDQIDFPPAAGNDALIQIDGIVRMVADGAVTTGDTVRVSAAVVGGVTDGSAAGTADAAAFGVALSAPSGAGKNIDVLLECGRNF